MTALNLKPYYRKRQNMNVLISNKLSINILIQLNLQFCIWARGIDPSTSKHFLVAGNSIWVCSSVESAHFTLGDWSESKI